MPQVNSENVTDDFVNYISSQFQNYPVDRGLTKIEDHTNRFGFGYEVRARGNAQIQTLVERSGEIFKVTGIPGLSYPLWSTESLVMVFSFTSWTQAESWTVPGGARVDYPWRSLRPSGKVRYILRTATLVSLELNDIVFDTHDDRPNNFVRDYVVPLFTGKLDNLIEAYTGMNVIS